MENWKSNLKFTEKVNGVPKNFYYSTEPKEEIFFNLKSY